LHGEGKVMLLIVHGVYNCLLKTQCLNFCVLLILTL